jgi:hypothetical protein
MCFQGSIQIGVVFLGGKTFDEGSQLRRICFDHQVNVLR